MDTISAALGWLVSFASQELLLFAAIGMLLIGVDDLLFDGLWIASTGRGASANFRAGPDSGGGESWPLQSGGAVDAEGPLAIFLPAWDEHEVLAETLAHMLTAWDGEDFRIYIGCYPNDQRTILSISDKVSVDHRLRLVVADRPGPTTKGHNLNQLWLALGADERASGRRFAAVVLHDAEDIVHPLELALYRRFLPNHAMVQIPVHAVMSRGSPWISGHYMDEFSEAHGKELRLRSTLGLPIPSAGVGCALSRAAVSLLAMERDGLPFRPESLTEDYEIGILMGSYGLSAMFADMRTEAGDPIVSRGEFPSEFAAAVRQKARWITGIALAGWGHLGWPALPAVRQQQPQGRQGRQGHQGKQARQGRLATWLGRWMLWRDRRAPLAAIIMLAGYLGLAFALIHAAGRSVLGWEGANWGMWLAPLLAINGAMLSWRLAMRAYFTTKNHGPMQGLLSIPRAVVANFVAIFSAYHAVKLYFQMIGTGRTIWTKTHHSRRIENRLKGGSH